MNNRWREGIKSDKQIKNNDSAAAKSTLFLLCCYLILLRAETNKLTLKHLDNDNVLLFWPHVKMKLILRLKHRSWFINTGYSINILNWINNAWKNLDVFWPFNINFDLKMYLDISFYIIVNSNLNTFIIYFRFASTNI